MLVKSITDRNLRTFMKNTAMGSTNFFDRKAG